MTGDRTREAARADRRRDRRAREARSTVRALLCVVGYAMLVACGLYLCGLAAFLVVA